MTTSQLDEAFEAYLAGRPVPAERASFMAFADSVREMSSRPARPNAALAELLTTGLLTVLAAVIAKFASAGAVAQAFAGLGAALVGVSTAGVAGVLPAPVQDGVAITIEAVTPFDLPDSTDAEETTAPASEETATEEEPEAGTGPADIPAIPDFGTSVSEDAQDGGVDGGQISEDARSTHQPEQTGASADRATAERPATSSAPASRPTQAPAPAPAPAPVEQPAERGGAATAPDAGQAQTGTGRP